MIKTKTISDFYKEDAIDYASYDNLRKLCSYIDGLKLSQRKLLYTMRDKYSKEFVKTETFANITTAYTQYLHGSANLGGVASNMAQNFVGSNNFPLFLGNSGGFGTRINPENAATRYTRMTISKISEFLFSKSDDKILESQMFEGDKIEPKYFIPIFPVIFLNGSEGLSTGFAETIYPRNPTEIIEYIIKKLKGTQHPQMKLLPWFKNFKGEVRENTETNIIEVIGKIEKINMTKYIISELPIGVSYQSYIKFLDKLSDNNDIVDYEDKCDTKTDTILFEIKTTRAFTNKHETSESLIKFFRLSRNLPETLCFIDEESKVREFKDIYEVLESYIKLRLNFYTKRKIFILKELKDKIMMLCSKYVFVKGICDETIIVNKRKKENIVKQLEKIDKIIKIDDSYDYLLRMQISSLTEEMLKELKEQLKNLKAEFDNLKDTSIENLWIEDLNKLKTNLRK